MALGPQGGVEAAAGLADVGGSLGTYNAGGNATTFHGKTGFKRAVRDAVTLSVGARVELNLTLEVGALAESVTVIESCPLA